MVCDKFRGAGQRGFGFQETVGFGVFGAYWVVQGNQLLLITVVVFCFDKRAPAAPSQQKVANVGT